MKIALDIDGVLCDHIEGLSDWLFEHHGITIRKSEVISWDHVVRNTPLTQVLEEAYRDNDFLLSLPAVPGAKEGVRLLEKAGNELVVVTSRPIVTKPATLSWIRSAFGFDRAIFAVNKAMADLDMLVDDNLDVAIRFANDCGKSMLFSQPWNSSGLLPPELVSIKKLFRVRDWWDVPRGIQEAREAG